MMECAESSSLSMKKLKEVNKVLMSFARAVSTEVRNGHQS